MNSHIKYEDSADNTVLMVRVDAEATVAVNQANAEGLMPDDVDKLGEQVSAPYDWIPALAIRFPSFSDQL